MKDKEIKKDKSKKTTKKVDNKKEVKEVKKTSSVKKNDTKVKSSPKTTKKIEKKEIVKEVDNKVDETIIKPKEKLFKKIISFLKKHWFILTILLLGLIRFLFTYKLPNFYINGLNYDDNLMVDQFESLLTGDYLGPFGFKTLIKGPLFPLLIFVIRLYKVSYSFAFSLLYILVCIYFVYALKHVINNKKYLIIIFVFLLFNPASYSQDLFQRLYRNSISITELVFFLGSVIRVLFVKEKKLYNYILLGISLSFMFLTREDNLWTYPVILFIPIYNIIKERKLKNIIFNIVPILILILSLNLVSFVNYKKYGMYTYNEIQKSEFHNTYKKVLQIKDDEKIDYVSVPKSTLYKLADNSELFGYTREEIDKFYKKYSDTNGEIYNGNFMWYFRYMIYKNKKFQNGKESEEFYKNFGEELDELFKSGKLEKEFTMPSSFMAVPTKKQLLSLPKELVNTIVYTSTYQDIKTLTDTKDYLFDIKVNSYFFKYRDYHHTVDIVEHNALRYEMVRQLYYSLTVVFGIISLIIYLRYIFKFDNISILSHILMVCYLLIIGGVTYTHITSFHAVRPLYLGNIYILQTIFILINMYRVKDKIKEIKLK